MASIAAAATLGAVGLLVIAVGTAPAGNRDPIVLFDDFPGPDEVTFGKNVAYTTSLENDTSSTLTHVFFRMKAPTTEVAGDTLYAQLVYASCEPNRTSFPGFGEGDTYECPEVAQIPSNADPVEITLVWQTPSPDPTGLTCDDPEVTDCSLHATAAWGIKENQPGGNDTFPVEEFTTLLVQPDPKQAGGYALTTVAPGACTTANANLTTNLSVGAGNKVATAVCASTKPMGDPLNPGLVIVIEEGAGPFNKEVTESASICIPDSGELCSDPGYDPWPFSPPGTFIFTIDNTTLPKGTKITQVFHDGVSDANDPKFSCSITIVNKTKKTIVTCQSAENGWWDFG